MATEPTAIAQTRMAQGAYGPPFAARDAGTTNMEAPTTMLTMLAARPHAPTVRINPASRVLVSIGAPYHGCARLRRPAPAKSMRLSRRALPALSRLPRGD